MNNIKNTIVLRKSGKFFNSFGDDAIILHYLLNYKIVAEKGGTGFPESAYNKVINTLLDSKISYIVYDREEIVDEKDFKKINNYNHILKKGIKNLEIEERYKKIEEKIKQLNSKQLDNLLDIIENAIQ